MRVMDWLPFGIFTILQIVLMTFSARWILDRSVRPEHLKSLTQTLADEQVRKLEQRLKSVEVEWENTYEKLIKLFGRITRWTNERFSPDAQGTPSNDNVNPDHAQPLEPNKAALWEAYRKLYAK